MATLAFDGIDDFVRFTPISSALSNLPNGAGTIAALARVGDTGDIAGMTNSAVSAWYHGLGRDGASRAADDDGTSVIRATAVTLTTSTAGAGNYRIIVGDWPAGGAATERFHWSATIGSAESWTHSVSTASNAGNRAGPGTGGYFRFGNYDSEGPLLGEIALVAVWAGVRLDDTGVEALWVSKQTSDWYNHAAGTPTMLVECTSTTPTDIGANPSTLSTVSGAAATGTDPTGWTFDGQGSTPPSIEDGFAAPAGMFSPTLIEKGWWH